MHTAPGITQTFGFDVSHYLLRVDARMRSESVEGLAISLSAVGERAGDCPFDPVTWICTWAAAGASEPVAVLGDVGSGKSWLCLRVASALGRAFRDDPSSGVVPLLVTFRTYRAGMDLSDLLTASLSKDWGIRDIDAFSVRSSVEEGRLLLILDGMDEMVRELGNREALSQFLRLQVPEQAKAIVTCRTHYFLSGNEQREMLRPDRAAPIGARTFQIMQLKPLDERQVQEAIVRRVPASDVSRVTQVIGETHHLSELSSRPVLLGMICKSWHHLASSERRTTAADLYEAFLRDWLDREVAAGRLEVTPDAALAVLERVAECAFRRNSTHVSTREVMGAVHGTEATSADSLTNALRRWSTSGIVRVAGADWEFGHRSVQEFLYARRFFSWEAESGGEGKFAVVHIPAWQFISQLSLSRWDERSARRWLQWRVSRSADPGLTLTTLRAASAYWLIHHDSAAAIANSLQEVMLDCVDLRTARLSGANLHRADLNGSDLRGVNLAGADLREAVLVGSDLRGADLSGADLSRADCRGAAFNGASLLGARCEGAIGLSTGVVGMRGR